MSPTPTQMSLDVSIEQQSRDVVVSPSNEAAINALNRWPDWPSNASILVGPEGSGKSYLGRIWAEMHDGLVCDVPEVPSDADHYPVVFVDSVQAGQFDQEQMFHLLNLTRSANTGLLFATRVPPTAWAVSIKDLKSRVEALPVAKIEHPDETLLSGILIKLFADRQITVEPAVISYLMARMERSLHIAHTMVEQLDQMALSEKRRVSRALAARLFD